MTLTHIGIVRGFTIEAVKIERVACPCGYGGIAAMGKSVAFCPDCGKVLWHRVCHDCKRPQAPSDVNKPCQHCGCPALVWTPTNWDRCIEEDRVLTLAEIKAGRKGGQDAQR